MENSSVETIPAIPGTDEVSSLGSLIHLSGGICRPCPFMWMAKGCRNGVNCSDCHMHVHVNAKRERCIRRKFMRLNTLKFWLGSNHPLVFAARAQAEEMAISSLSLAWLMCRPERFQLALHRASPRLKNIRERIDQIKQKAHREGIILTNIFFSALSPASNLNDEKNSNNKQSNIQDICMSYTNNHSLLNHPPCSCGGDHFKLVKEDLNKISLNESGGNEAVGPLLNTYSTSTTSCQHRGHNNITNHDTESEIFNDHSSLYLDSIHDNNFPQHLNNNHFYGPDQLNNLNQFKKQFFSHEPKRLEGSVSTLIKDKSSSKKKKEKLNGNHKKKNDDDDDYSMSHFNEDSDDCDDSIILTAMFGPSDLMNQVDETQINEYINRTYDNSSLSKQKEQLSWMRQFLKMAEWSPSHIDLWMRERPHIDQFLSSFCNKNNNNQSIVDTKSKATNNNIVRNISNPQANTCTNNNFGSGFANKEFQTDSIHHKVKTEVLLPHSSSLQQQQQPFHGDCDATTLNNHSQKQQQRFHNNHHHKNGNCFPPNVRVCDPQVPNKQPMMMSISHMKTVKDIDHSYLDAKDVTGHNNIPNNINNSNTSQSHKQNKHVFNINDSIPPFAHQSYSDLSIDTNHVSYKTANFENKVNGNNFITFNKNNNSNEFVHNNTSVGCSDFAISPIISQANIMNHQMTNQNSNNSHVSNNQHLTGQSPPNVFNQINHFNTHTNANLDFNSYSTDDDNNKNNMLSYLNSSIRDEYTQQNLIAENQFQPFFNPVMNRNLPLHLTAPPQNHIQQQPTISTTTPFLSSTTTSNIQPVEELHPSSVIPISDNTPLLRSELKYSPHHNHHNHASRKDTRRNNIFTYDEYANTKHIDASLNNVNNTLHHQFSNHSNKLNKFSINEKFAVALSNNNVNLDLFSSNEGLMRQYSPLESTMSTFSFPPLQTIKSPTSPFEQPTDMEYSGQQLDFIQGSDSCYTILSSSQQSGIYNYNQHNNQKSSAQTSTTMNALKQHQHHFDAFAAVSSPHPPQQQFIQQQPGTESSFLLNSDLYKNGSSSASKKKKKNNKESVLMEAMVSSSNPVEFHQKNYQHNVQPAVSSNYIPSNMNHLYYPDFKPQSGYSEAVPNAINDNLNRQQQQPHFNNVKTLNHTEHSRGGSSGIVNEVDKCSNYNPCHTNITSGLFMTMDNTSTHTGSSVKIAYNDINSNCSFNNSSVFSPHILLSPSSVTSNTQKHFNDDLQMTNGETNNKNYMHYPQRVPSISDIKGHNVNEVVSNVEKNSENTFMWPSTATTTANPPQPNDTSRHQDMLNFYSKHAMHNNNINPISTNAQVPLTPFSSSTNFSSNGKGDFMININNINNFNNSININNININNKNKSKSKSKNIFNHSGRTPLIHPHSASSSVSHKNNIHGDFQGSSTVKNIISHHNFGRNNLNEKTEVCLAPSVVKNNYFTKTSTTNTDSYDHLNHNDSQMCAMSNNINYQSYQSNHQLSYINNEFRNEFDYNCRNSSTDSSFVHYEPAIHVASMNTINNAANPSDLIMQPPPVELHAPPRSKLFYSQPINKVLSSIHSVSLSNNSHHKSNRHLIGDFTSTASTTTTSRTPIVNGDQARHTVESSLPLNNSEKFYNSGNVFNMNKVNHQLQNYLFNKNQDQPKILLTGEGIE